MKAIYTLLTALSCSLLLSSCNSGSSSANDNGTDGGDDTPPTEQRTWQILGDSSTISAGVANFQTIVIGSNGVPYVGFSDNAVGDADALDPAYHASVMQYQNDVWGYAGAADLFTDGKAFYIDMAINMSNIPYIAFSDKAHGYKTTAMKLVGNVWEIIGQPGFSEQDAYNQDIVIDSLGVPVIAGTEASNSIIRKLNGTLWAAINGRIAGTTRPSVAFDAIDSLDVAVEDLSTHTIRVLTPNGSNWISLGSPAVISANGQVASHPSLAIANNMKYVSFVEGNHIAVKKLQGDLWEPFGNNITIQNNPQALPPKNPKLVFDGSTPYLAYQDPINFNIKVLTLNVENNTWEEVDTDGVGIYTGTKAYNLDVGDTPILADGGFDLAISPDHVPYIAFKDNLNSGKTSVMTLVTQELNN